MPDVTEISSAKSKFSNLDRNFHVIPLLALSTVVFMIQSIKTKTKNPDILQPYFTIDFTSNQPVRPVKSIREHWLLLDIALIIWTTYSGIP